MRHPDRVRAHWSEEVETVVRYTIATALDRCPLSLPPMSREQMWASYKTACTLVELPEALSRTLTLGERIALQYGVKFNNQTFPEGETPRAIMLNITAVTEMLLKAGVLDPNDPLAEPNPGRLQMLVETFRQGAFRNLNVAPGD